MKKKRECRKRRVKEIVRREDRKRRIKKEKKEDGNAGRGGLRRIKGGVDNENENEEEEK